MVLGHIGSGLPGGQVSGTAPHLPFETSPWGTPLMEGITLWSRYGRRWLHPAQVSSQSSDGDMPWEGFQRDDQCGHHLGSILLLTHSPLLPPLWGQPGDMLLVPRQAYLSSFLFLGVQNAAVGADNPPPLPP